MNRISYLKALAIIASLMLVSGCGSSKAARQNAEIIETSKPVIVTKTGKDNRPEWCTEKPYEETDSGFLFSGGFLGGADYALTLRLAKSEATKNLLESVEIKARTEFSNAIHGQNRDEHDIGRYVTDAVAWTVENLRVRGIKQKEIYYEEIFDPLSQSFKYNTWVMLEISRGDYFKAKVDAARRLVDKATVEKDLEAKSKALELLERLKEEA